MAKKKAATKKTTRKSAAKTASKSSRSQKKAAVSKKTRDKTGGRKAAPKGEQQASTNEALKAISSRQRTTPSVFKVSQKKSAPVVFTLEDVREVLKQRKAEKKEDKGEKPARKSAKKKQAEKQTAVKKAPEPEPQATPAEHRRLGAASLNDILGIGPKPAQEKPGVSLNEDRVPKKWKKYYDLLVELRAHVREELDEHTKDTLKRSAKDDSGDISSFSSHMADNGTDAFDRDFALSLVSNEQEALAEIEDAIRRIYNGTYGVCEVTGQRIATERLEAVPFTRFSVEGQAQFENNRTRRSKRGGAFLDASGDESLSFSEDDDS